MLGLRSTKEFPSAFTAVDAVEIRKVLILELAFLSLDSSSDKCHG